MKNTEDTIAFLVRYNRWRRGDENIEQPNPQEVGEHLEAAIDLLRGEGTCLDCGGPLQAVRPGKHQCNCCDNFRHIETMLEETAKLAATLKRERDKAREDATNYYARTGELESALSYGKGTTLLDKWTKAIGERDEAQKEALYYKTRYELLKDSMNVFAAVEKTEQDFQQ